MRRNGFVAALCALGLAGGPRSPVLAGEAPRTRATSEALGGESRTLTLVGTDKPVYRPGETLYARAFVVHAKDFVPVPPGTGAATGQVEVKGPKGDTVASGSVQSELGVLAFSWDLPAESAGGEYTIRFTHPLTGHPEGERKFDVRAYRAPRLKTQIVFARDGYGPGDEAVATLSAERAEGGFPAAAKVSAVARIDGVDAWRGTLAVDPAGRCLVRFPLPAKIARGEGTLALTIEDGGVVETATKTIPILLQTLDIKMYAEGGTLVAGLPNRVYLEARTPYGKPADLAGTIVDADGREVARVRTEHEGRGRVELTPAAGVAYLLKVTEPAGIGTVFPLPPVEADGAVLAASEDLYPESGALRFRVGTTGGGQVRLTLSRHEVEVAEANLTIRGGKALEIPLIPRWDAAGVLTATLWSDDGRPLAERLVFRRPARRLAVTVTPKKSRLVPRDEVELEVRTVDAAGQPVAAVVGLAVVDDSVLELVETREQMPRLPAQALLEPEVLELRDAHVYLDPAHPKGPRALDLLLGTQGWRRFALVDTAKFLADHGAFARRALAFVRPPVPPSNALKRMRVMEGAIAFGAPGAPMPAAMPVRGAVPQAVPPPRPVPEPKAEAAKPRPVAEDLRQAVGGRRLAMPPMPPRDPGPQASEARRALAGIAAQEKEANRLGLDDDLALDEWIPPASYVRVYAHAARPAAAGTDRTDFTETLYWNAAVRTDASGRATVRFHLSDAVSSFKALADALGADGAMGAGRAVVESVRPFYLEPKLPLEITVGDRPEVPVAVVNGTDGPLAGGSLELAGAFQAKAGLAVGANARVRRLFPLTAGPAVGELEVAIAGTAGAFADRVVRKLAVKPSGFPVEASAGGVLEKDSTETLALAIPAELVRNSVETAVAVYPTPMANLTEALAALVREPYGCFEQTSSTSYPMVMAQQYFKSHTGIDPALVAKAEGLIESSLKRLMGFECKQHGYEWFGEDPGHEALTAYGLLQFADMAQVRAVDPKMVARTRTWLLGRRDGEGGFKRERRALHTWIEDRAASNAYITWAMLAAGETGLDREVEWVRNAALETKNSYVLALAANVLAEAGQKDESRRLAEKLAKLQDAKGMVGGATASIVGSGGEALAIETTALAVLAWLKHRELAGPVEKAIQGLAESCKGGRYGSTQSTVLALKAVVEYDRARSRPKAPGSLQLLVDGKPIGDPVAFDESTQGALTMPAAGELLAPGKHQVSIRMDRGAAMPYSITVRYHTLKPHSSPDCALDLAVTLKDREVQEGAVAEVEALVTNRTREAVPTPVAIVGLPGGLEPRHDQLKELVKAGKIAAYEVRGREVVLYWRELAKDAVVRVPLSCVAAIPGTYTGPASRAYLYYTDERKVWADPVGIRITARE